MSDLALEAHNESGRDIAVQRKPVLPTPQVPTNGNLAEPSRVNAWVQKSLENTRNFIKSLTLTAKEIIPASVGNLFAEFPEVKPQPKLQELVDQLGEEYGQESVGQNCLVLNERTRKPRPIDWQGDPARDITAHFLTSQTEEDYKDRGSLLIKKLVNRFKHIKESILKNGLICPTNYAELTNSHHIGHPSGSGPVALFVYQCPTVPSGEFRNDNDATYNVCRNSAIHIDQPTAKTLLDRSGNSDFLEEMNLNHTKPTEQLSYVPPERLAGVIQFADQAAFDRFTEDADTINHYEPKQNSPTEEQRIRHFVSKLRNDPGVKLEGSAMDLSKEQVLYLYGAMCARDYMEQLIAGTFEHLDDGIWAKFNPTREGYISGSIKGLDKFNPSFTATKQLKADAIYYLQSRMGS